MLNETETAAGPPGATMTPSQIKKLKIAIAVMSVLLVAGFILLVVGIYLQMQKAGKSAEGATAAAPPIGIYGTMTLPVRAGAEVTQMLTDQGRLILLLRQASGSEIAIIDLSTGREIQRLRLIPQE
jgi:uncharacterized membrane protein